MFEAFGNFWKVFGPNMSNLIPLLAIPVIGIGLWIAVGDKIAPLWQTLKARFKRASPLAPGESDAFETLMKAVDILGHDKNFKAAAEALKLAESVATPLKPVEPSNA